MLIIAVECDDPGKPANGRQIVEKGKAWGGIFLFSKICNQILYPRANHSSQMQPNCPTSAAHCCQSQGRTQESHDKNISK